jgi:hypothetical protein
MNQYLRFVLVCVLADAVGLTAACGRARAAELFPSNIPPPPAMLNPQAPQRSAPSAEQKTQVQEYGLSSAQRQKILDQARSLRPDDRKKLLEDVQRHLLDAASRNDTRQVGYYTEVLHILQGPDR